MGKRGEGNERSPPSVDRPSDQTVSYDIAIEEGDALLAPRPSHPNRRATLAGSIILIATWEYAENLAQEICIYNFDAARECDRFKQRAFPEATKVKNDHSIWRRRKNPLRCDAKSVMDIHELRGEGKLRA